MTKTEQIVGRRSLNHFMTLATQQIELLIKKRIHFQNIYANNSF